MRLLGRVRLSRFTEESTSPERQREIIEQYTALHGHEVVDWAVDLDVSRSVDPFETPELGPWFHPDKSPEWDGVICWKLDRIATGSIYLNKVMAWCNENGKTLISVTENLDLTTWIGRMIANVIAGVAEGELELIRERAQGSQAKLRQVGRYHGGPIPYGYKKVKRDGGWWLEIDQERAEVVREIFRRILDHQSVTSIADDLTARNVATDRGRRWWPQTIFKIVQSRNVLGQKDHEGSAVIGSDGLPLQRAVPILATSDGSPDLVLWQAAKAALDDSRRPKRRAFDQLLLDVAFCLLCGSKLYHRPVKQYRYWNCSGRTRGLTDCRAPGIPAEEIEGFVESELLEQIGHLEVMERVYVPGTDNSARRAQIEEAISTARKENDLGLYKGDEGSYLARMATLVERRNALDAEPDSGPRWELRSTGETYAERWNRSDDVGDRRRLLLDTGLTVKARSKPSEMISNIPLDVFAKAVPGFPAEPPTGVPDA